MKPFEEIEEYRVKPLKPRKNKILNIPVLGYKDPRGPDNNIRVWVDENNLFHIRVQKTNRCYQFKEMIDEEGYVEIIAQ